MCEHLVYFCCQINSQTVIESYNIVLHCEVEQMEMARTALKKCTEFQSVLFCCNSTSDSNGNRLPHTCKCITKFCFSKGFHLQRNHCSYWTLVQRQLQWQSFQFFYASQFSFLCYQKICLLLPQLCFSRGSTRSNSSPTLIS